MNNDDKNIKLLDNEASSVSNLNTPVLGFSGPLSPHLVEKRTLPLLYVQSAPVPKNTACNSNSSSNFSNSELICETSGHFNIPKLSASATLSPNGATKFVQVQSPNQNIAYVGTYFKQSNKGKDVIPQKVLLTPVKGKDVSSVTRLILPRPPNTSQNNISPASKQVCRSFVVSPVSQNTLVTSAIAVKTADGGGKIIQPGIIRQKNIETKVLTSGAIVQGGIIVPGKAPVPPPGLALLKSNTSPPQNLEKAGMKVVLLDIKEHEKQKKSTELSSELALEPKNNDSPVKLPVEMSDEISSPAKIFHENVPMEETDKMNISSQHTADLHKTSLATSKLEKFKSNCILREESPPLKDFPTSKAKVDCVGLSMPLLDIDPPITPAHEGLHIKSDSAVENSSFVSPQNDPSSSSTNALPATSGTHVFNAYSSTIVDNVSTTISSTVINNNPFSSLINSSHKTDAFNANIFAIRATNHCNVIGSNASNNILLNTFPVSAASIASPNSYAVAVSASCVESTTLPNSVTTNASATFSTVNMPNTILLSTLPSPSVSCAITVNPVASLNISTISSCTEAKSLISKIANASSSPLETNVSSGSSAANATSALTTCSSQISKVANVPSNSVTNNSSSNVSSISSCSVATSTPLPAKAANPALSTISTNPSLLSKNRDINPSLSTNSCVTSKTRDINPTVSTNSTATSKPRDINLNPTVSANSSVASKTRDINHSPSSVSISNKTPSSSTTSETTSQLLKATNASSSITVDNPPRKIGPEETKKSTPITNNPPHIPSSSGERARKRKGSLSTSVPSPSKTLVLGDNYENMKLFPGADEIDPFKVIQWDEQGLGKLPESDIKVVINAFNMIELFDSDKVKENSNNQKKEQIEEIYCCVSCGCYGLLSEFFNENYCSISCRDELFAQQYAIVAKNDPEIESSDKDKKKVIPEITSNKKTVSTNENNKNSPKPQVKPLDDNDKIYEQDIIEIEESSSTDAENTPKKNSNDDSSRTSKMKKVTPKASKPPVKKPEKPEKMSKAPNTPTNESKSKIKLRPRTAGKISKPVVPTQENIVQDLDVGTNATNDQSECSKRQSFRWATYLAQTKASPAWVKLFANAYPSKPNRFKVGHKLEAIDPEHQSYFCLVTVASVKGYRLKLHFDGYPSEYDFWVNADTPNIFPSEFCSSHKIPLHPPPGQASKTFDWNSYLARNNSKAAPPNCFENHFASSAQTNLFKVDMKLEAVDRKNTFLVCVATVAAVMENRILIHFDSWGDLYDYWVDISSPYIRPVGWCKNNNHELTPPNGIKSENFSWKKYLKETKSIAAPEKAFTLRPPIEFKKGMKIEAVDKRAPHLLRVATIAEVLPYQVKISFDGFPPHFGYWVDDDCPDIHPVGWASRAGHSLEPPPTVEDFENVICSTPGCIGQGFLHGTKEESHSEVKNCPYATENLGKDTALTDRLKWTKVKRSGTTNIFDDDSEEESDEDIESIRWSWLKVKHEENKNCKIKREEDKNFKNEYTRGDTVGKPEEIRQIFEPPSSIPTVEDTQETDYSVTNKTENESTTESKPLFEQDKVNTVAIKAETNIDSQLSPVTIKKECPEEDVSSLSKNGPEKRSVPYFCMPVTSENPVRQEIIDLTTPGDIKKEVNENEISDSSEIRNDEKTLNLIHASFKEANSKKPSIGGNGQKKKLEKSVNGPTGEKAKLEEKNVLFWTIHQVSQFTRPLISCADDCFLKEGIDGPGFLMLSKNDLLDYLGLSDSDAERVFRKISMLRKKCVLS